MAVRGSIAKARIGNILLQIFPGSFIDEDKKTIRIPCIEENSNIEIKVTLTAAKDVIGSGNAGTGVEASSKQPSPQNTEMTAEEIQQVRSLIEELGL